MKVFVVFACLVVAINGANLSPIRRHERLRPIFPNGKIVGGSIVQIEDVPWQVSLEDPIYGLFCGGSMISANYILTAAHCTDGSKPKDITVRTGTNKLQNGGKTYQVSEIAQNPNFNFEELDFDVSVLKLEKPIELSDASKPISLRAEEAKGGETSQVSGWGTLHEGDFDLPKNLHRVSVPVLSRKDCKDLYEPNGAGISENMICAGEAGKDSCQGDSGGAITIEDVQVGIVSWGFGCAEEGFPGVYTNAPALRKYIDDNSNNEATWV